MTDDGQWHDRGAEYPQDAEGTLSPCDLAAAYAVDAVDEQERAAVEQHLLTCEACRALVDELTEDAALLSAGLEVQPSAELRARVLDQVAAEPRREAPEASSPGVDRHEADEDDASLDEAYPRATGLTDVTSLEDARAGRHRGRTPRVPASRWLAAAAAAAVIGVGAWGISRTLEPDPVDQVVSAEDATEHTGDADAGEVVVITSVDSDGAVLRLPEGLAAPEEGSVYQAWFVGADGSARSAGVLTEDVLEEGEGRLEGTPEGAAAVGLSVEPDGGSEQPSTEPFVVVPLG